MDTNKSFRGHPNYSFVLVMGLFILLGCSLLVNSYAAVPSKKQAATPVVSHSVASTTGNQVASMSLWKQVAAPAAWDPVHNRVIYNQKGVDGIWDAYTANPDGSNPVCISCSQPVLPGAGTATERGASDVTPDGQFVIMTIESGNHFGPIGNTIAEPGKGVYNNLWLARSDGSQYWQLSDPTSKNPMATIIWPRFDRTGHTLVWAEMYRNIDATHYLGSWRLKTADIMWVNGKPQLTNVHSFQPGTKGYFYEPYGFSPDNSKILLASDYQQASAWNSQIWTLSRDFTKLQRISPNDAPSGFFTNYNEFAYYTPDGTHIIFGRTRGASRSGMDYWSVNSDGTSPHRLTYTNEPWNSDDHGYTQFGGLAIDPNNPNHILAGYSHHLGTSPDGAMNIYLDNGGLKGTYYAKDNFVQPMYTRTENPSDGLKWYGNPVDDGLPSANFSARWTGSITAPASGTYGFCVYADDGARLKLDNASVINAWYGWPTKHCNTLSLTAGKHAIELDYHNTWLSGSLQLTWQTPGNSGYGKIPTANLAP